MSAGLRDVGPREIVVLSLEPWDNVWRRNQFLVDALLRRHPDLQVLFVEPPADPAFDLKSRRRPSIPRWRRLMHDGRLRAFRPLKPFPRRFGRIADESLLRQVSLAIRLSGFSTSLLWINDVTYAPLVSRTGWPSLYDVTDDWLLAPHAPRELERLTRLDCLALRVADEVVVCSPGLASTRGASREVSLIPNGVDPDHFRRPRPRPIDLPSSPVALYAGSLHESRLDVDLVVELARAIPELSLALVGPSSLSPESNALFDSLPNIALLGARAYEDVPGYLQHADAIVVPHLVSAFTESLDPIKAYECLAVPTPTVATPIAGFREHPAAICLAERSEFVERVRQILKNRPSRPHIELGSMTWAARAEQFEEALLQSLRRRTSSAAGSGADDG
jgi:teichuronic acid biosynthesis glycosyltransferase TuaH